MKRRLEDLERRGNAPADASQWIAVLPLGATEQHGPHLPPETDSLIAEALVERLIERLPDSAPVVFLPVETVGYSPEHMFSAETQSLEWDQAVRRWVRIGEQAHRSGIRKFLMLNAHGGNSPLMTIVATELRARFNMLAVATSWTRFGLPDGVMSAEHKHLDIHGGLIETSVMLAIQPETGGHGAGRGFRLAPGRLYARLRASQGLWPACLRLADDGHLRGGRGWQRGGRFG